MIPSHLRYAAVAGGIAAVVGCSDPGPGRVRLQGAVTYNGQPVPAGQVRFEPDTAKGGSGPAGYARIIEGRYDTSSGKGPVLGPMRVRVDGYVSSKPFAPPMFPSQTLEVTVDGGGDVDLEIPKIAGSRGT